jgi:hypothetical protein
MSYQSIYIGYAPASCTTEKIKIEFDTFLKCNIVSKVDERIKIDMKGFHYKIFFVHFSWVNPPLKQLFEEISQNQQAKVNRWTVKFNTRLRDTLVHYTPLEIKEDEYWVTLANEFKS